MDKLLKSYGGIDGIIETIKGMMGSGESLYNNAFWTTVIYCLQDYKRLREANKRQKVINDGWEEAKNPIITCCKCHGYGYYDVYEYDENDMLDSISTNKCEVCHGTGKITLEFYEDLQRGCRR